jgi:hypothetical protein
VDTRVVETREKRDALAGILLVFANVIRANRGRVKLETIRLDWRFNRR